MTDVDTGLEVKLDIMPSAQGRYVITDSLKRLCRQADPSEFAALDQAGHHRLKRHNCQNVY